MWKTDWEYWTARPDGSHVLLFAESAGLAAEGVLERLDQLAAERPGAVVFAAPAGLPGPDARRWAGTHELVRPRVDRFEEQHREFLAMLDHCRRAR